MSVPIDHAAYFAAWRPEDLAIKAADDAARRELLEGLPLSADLLVGLLADGPLRCAPCPYPAACIVAATVAGPPAPGTCVTVPDVATFAARLPTPFCKPDFDWTHVVLAGGCVTTCVAADAPTADALAAIDVDLFVCGADDVVTVLKRVFVAVAAIYDVEGEVPDYELPYALTRTVDGVTMTCRAVGARLPPLRVQVILRRYRDAHHVLSGFDLDACALAFDGATIVALPRAVRALRWRVNLVDPDRQSTTYERRLVKYAISKGIAIAMPGIDIASVPVGRLLTSVPPVPPPPPAA
jgi:hypothetical protein